MFNCLLLMILFLEDYPSNKGSCHLMTGNLFTPLSKPLWLCTWQLQREILNESSMEDYK